jgi:hypothetical protein
VPHAHHLQQRRALLLRPPPRALLGAGARVRPDPCPPHPRHRLDQQASGSTILGPLDEHIIVRGRLIAADEAALWALRDALTAAIEDPPQPHALTDSHGRTWPDAALLTVAWSDRTDRARAHSLAYTATFRRTPA